MTKHYCDECEHEKSDGAECVRCEKNNRFKPKTKLGATRTQCPCQACTGQIKDCWCSKCLSKNNCKWAKVDDCRREGKP